MTMKNTTVGERMAYSIPEAAAMAGVSRSLVYKQMGAGRLGAIKIGKRRLIPADALRAWIASAPAA